MTVTPQLREHFSALLGDRLLNENAVTAGSSAFHQTYRMRGANADYFVKTNELRFASAMDAEFDGLCELQHERVRTPQPLVSGIFENQSFLIMEYLPLQPMSALAQMRLGQDLALMHTSGKDYFGWHRDNTIGLTPQCNDRHQDWCQFFCAQRLQPMQALLKNRQGAKSIVSEIETLLPLVTKLLADADAVPVLLHGDLWAGNGAMLADQTPVVFDAAVFYGERESDIAMSELFGGFTTDFYSAYREIHADRPRGETRRDLYRLYHLLNHCVLFGASYFAQTSQLLHKLVAVLSCE